MLEPDCLIPAVMHQPGGENIQLVVAEDDSGFHACLPVSRLERWGHLPYPVVTSHVRRMTYLGTPLARAATGDQAMHVVLSTLVGARRELGARFFDLQWVTEEGPVARHILHAAARLRLPVWTYESFERGLLLRESHDRWRRVPGQTPSEIRRRRRRLGELLGGELALADVTDNPSAPRAYLDIEASGRKLANGVATRAVAGESEYFVDMCRSFAARRRLHVLALAGGGKTVAMQVWIRAGSGIFLIKNSYHEEYRRFGAGVQLHLEAIDHFHRSTDAGWIDTCTYAGNDLLLDLYPQRRRISSFLVGLGAPSDRVVLASYRAARAISHTVPGVRSRLRSARHSPTDIHQT